MKKSTSMLSRQSSINNNSAGNSGMLTKKRSMRGQPNQAANFDTISFGQQSEPAEEVGSVVSSHSKFKKAAQQVAKKSKR